MDKASDLENELMEWVRHSTLPLHPKSLAVSTFEDALGQEGWQILVTLPKPEGATWEPDSLFEMRRAVSERSNEIARSLGAELPGLTLVKVTTDEADEGDLALVDAEDEER